MDDVLDRRPDGEEPPADADGASESAARAEGPGAEADRDRLGGRAALSDEVARRWDPARLVKSVRKGGGAGEPLDATTRARFERKLGVDLGGVRIYSGEFAEKVTKQHSAEAVTVGGTGMILMSGTPDRSPATAAGQALLAHELTHVAQSERGVYRSAPGQPAPLATQEHEAEAERNEAEVLSEAAGSAGPRRPSTGETVDPVKAFEDLVDRVAARVVEMVYEDERVEALRNGDERMRL
jgi:hypothetical protein